jgi:hypothetical protein
MFQPPIATMPAQADVLSPVSAMAALSNGGAGDSGSLIERLLTRAQEAQDASTQQLSRHLDRLDAGRVSTSDMLRLQADFGDFAVRVQITVRVADQVGQAIQTLSQRS